MRMPEQHPLDATDAGLYAAVVLFWGTSWIALKAQLGVVAPEVSLVWRFLIATGVMFAILSASRQKLDFPLTAHLRFAGMGALIFSTNFALFYHGAAHLPSGLLSVVFSLASVFNILLGALLFGERISVRLMFGALLGFSGVGAMFWPQFSGASLNIDVLAGLGLCVAGTLSFCLGNMLSASNQRIGLPVLPSNGWGMAYGVIFLSLFAFLRGEAFIIEWTPRYLGSLVFLAVAASVLAFAAYLTLLGRIGPARTGYSTVIYPVVALMISTMFEDYHWTLPAILGLALVVAGNLLVLRAPHGVTPPPSVR